MQTKQRKKSWKQKFSAVRNSYERCVKSDEYFAHIFYDNLFFLNPKIKKYFKNTDWDHQRKALLHGLDHLFNYYDAKDEEYHKKQILRIGKTHSRQNLDIHPHDYYYWIEALALTLEALDDKWSDDIKFYTRECIFLPVSIIISLYHDKK